MLLNRVYKVVVVEDEPIILKNTIQKIKDASPFFDVAGSAKNGRDAIHVIESVTPDVLFTDIRMPKMDGLELIRQIKDLYPNMHIIILSGYNDFEYAQQAIKLGVKDYLLKPLKIDYLKELLESVKTRLDSITSNIEREILFSGLNTPVSNNKLPYTLKNTHFSIVLLCIGHLCNQISSSTQISFFSDVWSKIDWTHILPQDVHWWIIDEKQPNQKFLILSSESSMNDLSQFALQVKDSLSAILAPFPVYICINYTPISYSEIWFRALELRFLLNQGLVIGKSMVITPSASNNARLPPAILDIAFQNKISTLINQGNKVLLQRELNLQFNKWEHSNYPQMWVENVLHQLVKLFQRQFSSITEEEIFQIEYELKEKLSISPDFSCICKDILNILNSNLSSVCDEKDDMKGFIENVKSYVTNNYTSNISIEDIAQKFNINPTYLSKLFKKYLNETPAKYIIKLRISEAKHLMESNPELDIKEICELVGYTDQHYFSRIFKETTSISPSAYRESLNC